MRNKQSKTQIYASLQSSNNRKIKKKLYFSELTPQSVHVSPVVPSYCFYQNPKFCATTIDGSGSAWISLNFEEIMTFVSVKVTLRADCCSELTKNIFIYGTETLPSTVSTIQTGQRFGFYMGPGSNGEIIEIEGLSTGSHMTLLGKLNIIISSVNNNNKILETKLLVL